MKMWRPLTCATVAVLVACGGGGGGSAPAPGIVTPPPVAGPTVPVSFKIKVSGTGASSAARKPAFVSPATQSVTIAVGVGSATPALVATANLTGSGSNCVTDNTGNTICTITAGIPAGSDTIVITCWSGANGTGNQLSTASLVQAIANNAANVVSFTLNGVVATTAVILGSTSVLVGTPATVAVTVIGYDASGAIIIGPGNYSTPITLTDADTSGATSLTVGSNPPQATGVTVTVSAPGTNVTLNYSGGTLAGATLTPSLGSTTGTAQTFAPTGTAIAVFTLPVGGFGTDIIAPGPDGNTWFAASGAIGFVTNSGASTIYTSNVPMTDVYGLAAASGAEWFGDSYGELGSITPGGAVTYVASIAQPNGCGNGPSTAAKGRSAGTPQAKRRTLNAPPEACGSIEWMAAGPDGNVWFSDSYGLIGAISPGSNTAQEWPISGFVGGNSSPSQFAFGSDGKMYVADYTGFIEQVTIGGGSVTAVNQLSMTFGCGTPYSLAIGPDGTAWFNDGYSGEGVCTTVGAIPTGAGFQAANMQAWQIGTIINNNPVNYFVGTPGGVWIPTYTYNTSSTPSLFRLTNAGTTTAPSPVMSTVTPFSSSSAIVSVAGLGANGNLWAANLCPYPDQVAKILYGAPQTGSLSVVRTKATRQATRGTQSKRRPQYAQGCSPQAPPSSLPSGG